MELLAYREKKLKDHQKRIQEIMYKNTKNALSKTNSKKGDKSFKSNPKEAEINKENSILFNKLMEISMGKRSNMPFKSERKSKHYISQSPMRSLPQLKPQKEDPHSLNFVSRKKEKERIDRENLKLAAKLVTQQSTLNKSKLLEEYRRIEEYK